MTILRGFILFALSALALPAATLAADFKQGDVEIGQVWARATPQGAKNGAAYLVLKNSGKEADTLKSVQSQIADRTEIHEHIHEGDVMKMRQVSGGLAIPAGGTVPFKPGGYHIMLMGLKQRLEEGQHIPLKLSFAKAGEVTVDAQVEKTEPHGTSSH